MWVARLAPGLTGAYRLYRPCAPVVCGLAMEHLNPYNLDSSGILHDYPVLLTTSTIYSCQEFPVH